MEIKDFYEYDNRDYPEISEEAVETMVERAEQVRDEQRESGVVEQPTLEQQQHDTITKLIKEKK